LLKDIAGLADISTTFDSYGRVSELKIGGKSGETVLDINGHKKISVVSAENTISVGGDANNKVTFTSNLPVGTIVIEGYTPTEPAFKAVDVNEGEIGGFQAASKEIDVRLEELNTFVTKFAETINTAYRNEAGIDFFDLGTDSTKVLENIKVTQSLQENPATLKTGKGATPAPGDGSLAKDIEKLFNTKDAGDQMTFSERYNNIVTKNGISKQQADNIAASQLTVLNQLEYKNESISGVNLNEEVSDVIRFSQAFQANARVIQTISDMLDTLINRTGA
jgi:flagellar hook-associated protein 1 FlgK